MVLFINPSQPQAEVMAESPEPKRPSSPAVEIKAEVPQAPVVPKVVETKAEAPVEPVKPKVESLNLRFFLGGKWSHLTKIIQMRWVENTPGSLLDGVFFSRFFMFHPYLGEDEPILTNIFQMGGSINFLRKRSKLPHGHGLILDDDEIWDLDGRFDVDEIRWVMGIMRNIKVCIANALHDNNSVYIWTAYRYTCVCLCYFMCLLLYII